MTQTGTGMESCHRCGANVVSHHYNGLDYCPGCAIAAGIVAPPTHGVAKDTPDGLKITVVVKIEGADQ